MLSAKLSVGSGMTFLKKFRIDLSRADLCGRHCTPVRGESDEISKPQQVKQQVIVVREVERTAPLPDFGKDSILTLHSTVADVSLLSAAWAASAA